MKECDEIKKVGGWLNSRIPAFNLENFSIILRDSRNFGILIYVDDEIWYSAHYEYNPTTNELKKRDDVIGK